MANNLSDKAIGTRVKLYGCYILYEFAMFTQILDMELFYKTCRTNVVKSESEEKWQKSKETKEGKKEAMTHHKCYGLKYAFRLVC